jgi:hypothetical protein
MAASVKIGFWEPGGEEFPWSCAYAQGTINRLAHTTTKTNTPSLYFRTISLTISIPLNVAAALL